MGASARSWRRSATGALPAVALADDLVHRPLERINREIKRVKRAAFGLRRFAHCRVRALLYADMPGGALLVGFTPG